MAHIINLECKLPSDLPASDDASLCPSDGDIVTDDDELDIIDFVRMQGCVMFLCEPKIQNIAGVVSLYYA